MTHEEQQALFDTILRRANLPGSFNVENGIRLTSLSDGGAEGEVRLTAGHLNPLGIVHGGVYCTLLDQVAGAAACTRGSRGLTVNCETRFLGIAQGDPIRISTPCGSIEVGANITRMTQSGVVHMYHGFPAADVNTLLSADYLDPISGFPGYRSSLCRVDKIGGTNP